MVMGSPEARRKAYDRMILKRKNDPVYRLFYRAKEKAKKEQRDFNLDRSDIIVPLVCPVLNVPFEFGTYYTATLDRIDSSKGYVKGNIQVMSHKANTMKNSATPEELLKFADWIYKTYKESNN